MSSKSLNPSCVNSAHILNQVQAEIMRSLFGRNDVLAYLSTSSSNRASFLIPIIRTLTDDFQESTTNKYPASPSALIVDAGKESGYETYQEALQHCYNKKVTTAFCHDLDCRKQLEQSCDILIGTPRRLLYLISDGEVSFHKIKFFVLYGADVLLDFGLMGLTKIIADQLPSLELRTNVMFSKTFGIGVKKAAELFLDPDYNLLDYGFENHRQNTSHYLLRVTKQNKREELVRILCGIPKHEKVVVFCKKSSTFSDFLAVFICSKGISATCVHNLRVSQYRKSALCEFVGGVRKVLVATSLKWKELESANVSHLINFDLPNSHDEYMERLEQTGRQGGDSLKVINFFDKLTDTKMIGPMMAIFKDAGQATPEYFQGYEDDTVFQ